MSSSQSNGDGDLNIRTYEQELRANNYSNFSTFLTLKLKNITDQQEEKALYDRFCNNANVWKNADRAIDFACVMLSRLPAKTCEILTKFKQQLEANHIKKDADDINHIIEWLDENMAHEWSKYGFASQDAYQKMHQYYRGLKSSKR